MLLMILTDFLIKKQVCEPRVAEGDQVDYMDIVQGVDEFDGQDVETEGWRLNSMLWCTCQTSFLL